MLMLKKNRFGISMMVFVFTLSLASASVDVSKVIYTPVSGTNLETELNNQINVAKGQNKFFYIGVACAATSHKAPIQTLCKRQGDTSEPATATKCNNYSTHDKDEQVVNEKCGVKLNKVFYPNTFRTRKDAYAIEKKLIAKYFNNCRVDPLCLNRSPGHDSCVTETNAIVYLRIYG